MNRKGMERGTSTSGEEKMTDCRRVVVGVNRRRNWSKKEDFFSQVLIGIVKPEITLTDKIINPHTRERGQGYSIVKVQ